MKSANFLRLGDKMLDLWNPRNLHASKICTYAVCCKQIVDVAIPCIFLIEVPDAEVMMGGAPAANG